MGSRCQSTIMALAAAWPATSTSKMVLWPVSEKRIREICLGSTSMATGSWPAPYRTAGILPATRTRRAAFLVNLPSRGLAATTSGMGLSFPVSGTDWSAPFVRGTRSGSRGHLVEQRTDAGFHVNALDSRAQQAGNGQHFDLGQFLRRFAQRDGIGDNHLLEARIGNAVNGRARKHGMACTRIHGSRTGCVERVHGLHQRAGRVDDVVNNEAGFARHVTDHIHHFCNVHICT